MIKADIAKLKEVQMAKRGRPVGSGKPPGEKFILKAFKLPPALWEEFAALVPKNEWSATLRRYMHREIQRRKKERE
jgi:hypothetical protein